MSWKDRLRETITLTSPDGNIFEALWRGNPRSKEKKLGIFEYPKVKGTIVQDLDVNGSRYPITLFFDGSDNDLESQRFFKAASENGKWNIIHPVLGSLTLQLVSITEVINPVESGNVTQFDTSWIEPNETSIIQSILQAIGNIRELINEINDVASGQYVENITSDNKVEAVTVKNSIDKFITIYNKTIKTVYDASSAISSQVEAIQRDITNIVNEDPLDYESLAGQVQNLVALPASITEVSYSQRLTSYNELATGVIAELPEDATKSSKNVVMTFELVLTSVLSAVALIAATSILAGELNTESQFIQTRKQAFDAADFLSTIFISITDSLDDVQETFIDNAIDLQYFSQSSSFSDTTLIMANAISYLIRSSFSLAAEKTFVLKKQRAPIEITISEYGDLGDNDSNFDFFIQTNNLKGNEILLLPAGKEVVIYV